MLLQRNQLICAALVEASFYVDYSENGSHIADLDRHISRGKLIDSHQLRTYVVKF